MSRAAILAGLLVWLMGAFPSAGAMPFTAELDKLFTNYTVGKLPGVAVAVVQNEKLVYQRTVGYADLQTKRLITPETVFNLGSLSRQFTAMGIMLLADKKKLAYDDLLSAHLPEFGGVGKEITLRHLLNHTSGLPGYEQLLRQSGAIDTNYPRQFQLRAGFEPTSAEIITLLTNQAKLRFPPGERWEDCDSDYVVLGQVIERVAQKPYARFLKENIFRPLGMTNTMVYDQTRPHIPSRAASYQREGEWVLPIDYTPLNQIFGESNVHSSLADLLRWDRAIYRGKLASKAAWNEAFTPGVLNDGSHVAYGFGWALGERDGQPCAQQTGAWAGFRSYFLHCPAQGFSIIILSNGAETEVNALAEKIGKICWGS